MNSNQKEVAKTALEPNTLPASSFAVIVILANSIICVATFWIPHSYFTSRWVDALPVAVLFAQTGLCGIFAGLISPIWLQAIAGLLGWGWCATYAGLAFRAAPNNEPAFIALAGVTIVTIFVSIVRMLRFRLVSIEQLSEIQVGEGLQFRISQLLIATFVAAALTQIARVLWPYIEIYAPWGFLLYCGYICFTSLICLWAFFGLKRFLLRAIVAIPILVGFGFALCLLLGGKQLAKEDWTFFLSLAISNFTVLYLNLGLARWAGFRLVSRTKKSVSEPRIAAS